MYVTIGELRHRITVLRPRAQPDVAGNLVEQELLPLFSTWAKVLPFAAKISDGYAEQIKEVDYRIVIRYREGICDTDLVLWRGKKLRLSAPPYGLDGKKKWLAMECREMVENE